MRGKYRPRRPQWLGAADHKQDALAELWKGISGLEYSVGNVLFCQNGMGNSLGFGLWEEGSFIQVLTPQKIAPRNVLRLRCIFSPMILCSFSSVTRTMKWPQFLERQKIICIEKCFIFENKLYLVVLPPWEVWFGFFFGRGGEGGVCSTHLSSVVFIPSTGFAPFWWSFSVFSQGSHDSTFSGTKVQPLGGNWELIKLPSFFRVLRNPCVPCVKEGATEEGTVRVLLCYIFSFTSSSGVDISCLTQFCCKVILWFLDSFSVPQSPTILDTSESWRSRALVWSIL